MNNKDNKDFTNDTNFNIDGDINLLDQGVLYDLSGLVKTSVNRMRLVIIDLNKKVKSGMVQSGVNEWLFDNYYLIKQCSNRSLASLKGLKGLRYVKRGQKKYPYIFFAANEFLEQNNNIVDELLIKNYILRNNDRLDLKNCELGVFTLMLKLCLIVRIYSIVESPHPNDDFTLVRAMGNAVASIRFLNSYDFVDTFLELSRINNILMSDPSGIYEKTDKKTRLYYLSSLEELAKTRKSSEVKTAQEIVELCKKSKDEQKRHVGYWILYSKENNEKKKNMQVLYFLLMGLIWVLGLFLLGIITLDVFVIIICAFVFADIVKNIANQVVIKNVAPAVIPKMEYKEGIPKEQATLVVISVLLTDQRAVEEALGLIERYYLCNKEENVFFGILGDFKDSEKLDKEANNKIRDALVKGTGELNKKYPDGPFCAFLRAQSFNPMQKKYMSYERKRGALKELAALIKTGDKGSFDTIVCGCEMSIFKNIITLDSDTALLPDTAKELIKAMGHPLNKPQYNTQKTRVISGYGILQPRVAIDLGAANKTPFTKIFCGPGGIDTYSSRSSDIYQDLFSEGIFCGKGILNVDAFYDILHQGLPDNRILSHDLIEGCYVRAGFISDVELTDGFPKTALSYFSRQNRWIRGDFQIAGWLFKTVKNSSGERVQNPINKISKFKISDNLFRALLPVFLAAGLLYGAALNNLAGVVCMAAVLFDIFFPVFVEISHRISTHVENFRVRSSIIYGVWQKFLYSGLNLCMALYIAFDNLCAVVVTLYRMAVKKNLLCWVTASQGEQRNKNSVLWYIEKMWVSIVIPPIVLAFDKNVFIWIITVLFFISPFLAFITGREKHKAASLSKEKNETLLLYAKKMWDYFEDFANKENNFLPPDNFQEDPYNGLAYRTSPTNIGLYMLCLLCAYDFSFIDKDTLFERLQKTVCTVEALDKWEGHLYNWYDTKTLEVLKPRYVSTVDSGNFVGYVITLIEGLKKIEPQNEILKRLERLVYDADFSNLYCEKKHLFYIGYNKQDERFDNSYYDLMASEARQTSFIAIALRQIPKEHWEKLSRSLSKFNGYRGYYSWTGTMFEYFMPNLIMPAYENSMVYESLLYALYCQIKAAGRGNIWGISESAYYGFDSAFNYQYKAFGVQRLALKRGMDRERVVSPYSTFLSMLINKDAGYSNLLKYLKIYELGRYGFYESVDFSAAAGDLGHMVVKSYMSHHLGMSIVALDNVINGSIMQKRFMANESMGAFSSLLKEKVSLEQQAANDFVTSDIKAKPAAIKKSHSVKRIRDINCFYPKMNALGSKNYATIHADSGASYSAFGNINVTRRDFCVENPQGIYFFTGSTPKNCVSLTLAPCYQPSVKYETKFAQHTSVFSGMSPHYHTKLEVAGGAGMPLEARKISVKNLDDDKEELTLALYFEPTLTTHGADTDHRTFSNLFIETSFLKEHNIILVKRRTRDQQKEVYLAVTLFSKDGNFEFETRRPQVLRRKSLLKDIRYKMFESISSWSGSVLDPCVFIKTSVLCPKGHTAVSYMAMACGENPNELIELVKSYTCHDGFEKLKEMSKTRAFAENQVSFIEDKHRQMLYDVLPCMFKNMPGRETVKKHVLQNSLKQDSLWKYGISGDNPIILISLNSSDEIKHLSDYLKVFVILMLRAVRADMIIAYCEAGQYDKPLYTAINDTIEKNNLMGFLHAFGGIHPVNLKAINESDINLILSSADYYFNVNEAFEHKERPGIFKYPECEDYWQNEEPNYKKYVSGLEFFNGYGGFLENGYVIPDNNIPTPKPYSHIISNSMAGAVLTAGGGGFSFVKNARQNKITRWSADPLTEPSQEQLKLVFEDKEVSFHLSCESSGKKSVEYAPGFAKYNLDTNEICASETIFMPNNFPCVARIVELENKSTEDRHFKVMFICRLVLGVHENITRKYIVTGFCKDKNMLWAKNRYNLDFSQMNTFLYCSENFNYTCDYNDVLQKIYDGGTDGVPDDACFCISVDVTLCAGEKKQMVILLGQYEKDEQLNSMISYLGEPQKAELELCSVKKKYDDFLGKIKIKTPSREFDRLMNGFILYQSYVCRMLAKTSFYQCGGAYGFRDQLQDCLAFMLIDPKIARAHILRCAAHQFLEGDVQHWWHPIDCGEKMGHKGVRTKYSDDLLWLCYVVCEYVRVSGDYQILDVEINYLEQEPLKPDEHERYSVPKVSQTKQSLYYHCMRAINYSLNFGPNGLCKIRGGDWNDGMNMIGVENQGESVWLSWFFAKVLNDFSKICEFKEEQNEAQELKLQADRLFSNIEKNAWDTQWYIRAFFDDGTPVGSNISDECKIDSIAQSFSVISNPKDISERKLTALKSAVEYLYDRNEKIVKLFTPAFDKTNKNPGYIKGYVKGVRENGGQYTHASIWLCMALFLSHQSDLAFEMMDAINPINHSKDKSGADKYKIEPYVIAADVYSNSAFLGLGGWSWYTGAASWYYVVAIQSMLGLYVEKDKIILNPNLPDSWDGVQIDYRYKNSVYNIKIQNRHKYGGVKYLYIDGVLQKDNIILLSDENESYTVEIHV